MNIDWSGWFVDLPATVDIGLRITVVLAATWIVHIALARKNPRWRTLLWRSTIVGLIAIPVLVAAMPKARFAVAPSRPFSGSSPLADRDNPWTRPIEYSMADATSQEEPLHSETTDSTEADGDAHAALACGPSHRRRRPAVPEAFQVVPDRGRRAFVDGFAVCGAQSVAGEPGPRGGSLTVIWPHS